MRFKHYAQHQAMIFEPCEFNPSSALGLSGGAAGSGFAAPTGTNDADLARAQQQQQEVFGQQRGFLQALQNQNGLGNQASVFNQQQGLANQLQGVANGTGPNPAQAQLAQSTGQNVSNQAALMAGQRGSSANAGLIARQAAMQGANTQQQAAGQGATMQAQQSLAAMQQLQNQQASMGNMANTQVANQAAANQNINQNALQGQSNLMSMQGNINQANAGLAGATQGNQSNMLGALAGGASSLMSSGGGGSSSGSNGLNSNGSIGGSTYAPVQGDASGGPAAGNDNVAAEGGEVSQLPKAKYASGGVASDPLMQPVQAQTVAPVAPVNMTPPASAGPQSGIGKQMAMPQGDVAKPSSGGGSNPMSAVMGGMSAVAGKALPAMQSAGGKALKFGKDAWNYVGQAGKSGASEAGTSVEGAAPSGATGIPLANNTPGTTAPSLGTTPAPSKGPPPNGTTVPYQGNQGINEAEGGVVPAMVSPGEQYLKPKDVQKVKKGANPLAVGERIPGKPKFKGNNYANDIVPKKLESGGIVIPNNIMQSKNPHWEAMKFVHATIAKNRKR